MEPVADWSGLLDELLVEIAGRVHLVEDFMAFRGVCSSWRAAASKDKLRRRPWVPLLMLAEKEDSDEREFYSLYKRKICMKLPLPEAKGKKCMEARFGWFLTTSSSGEVSLWNPWSCAKIELPNFTTFPEYSDYKWDPGYGFIQRAVLSANPSETSDFVLLVVPNMFLGFWRSGDKNWTRIESYNGAFATITYYNHKFYAINYGGTIWVWDPNSGPDLKVAHALFAVDIQLVAYRVSYLVESSDGELLIITRKGEGPQVDGSYGADNFGLIRLDVITGEFEEISRLEKDAIFLGENAAVAVPASAFPDEIKANCIYFTDDCVTSYYHGYGSKGGGKDMGVFKIEEQSIERFDIESLSFVCPPLWIAPS